MPANAIDLTTLGDVKKWLSGSADMSDKDDILLARLITAASQFIFTYINRFDTGGSQKACTPAQSFSRRFDGYGGDELLLPEYPITEVSLVQVGLTAIPQSPDAVVSGWMIGQDGNSVVIVGSGGYRFQRGRNNVLINWKAGYAAVPFDLAQACIELVALKYKRRMSINNVSSALPNMGGTVMYSQKDMSEEIRTLLQQYKRVAPI